MNSSTSVEAMLAESVEDFFAAHGDLRPVRRAEAGEPTGPLWQHVIETGYADALVPEVQGGSGLSIADAASIAFGSGRHAWPLPLAHTMVARAGLAERGFDIPAGAIAIAETVQGSKGNWLEARAIPFGSMADWVLVSLSDADWLLPTDAAQRVSCPWRPLAADLRWDTIPAEARRWARVEASGAPSVDWATQAAALTAAHIAGALQRVAEMTIGYANERVQFGKPIGKLQAIQQQISVLAEQLAACRCAARMGLCPREGSTWRVDPLRAAVAKARASEAVTIAAPIAHAVHGAIGISEEYDLQVLTRHMHAWRLQYGSEAHWYERVGAALLRDDRSAARFVQQRLAAPAEATP
jgi:alkylation response protein AidB-like acyl-CoA dehydrogenase